MATRNSNLPSTTSHQHDLKAALTSFETALATPVVSGELADWLDAVDNAWNEASAQVHYTVKHAHPRQYEEISNQDAELLPRVEQLRREDTTIESERESFSQFLERVRMHVPKLEPDEEKAHQHIQKLVAMGLAFITRVRKQEVALETWYTEAFTRDLGAGD